ncbi:MAG: hypothetical protein EOO09_06930 [Chitinophagaceae bacterium]|nr:MAG: hypothetical protein EOO09_06930 [Chitinophagaceae bacterium]
MKFVYLVFLATALFACNNDSGSETEVDPVPDTSAMHDPAPVITTASTPVNTQVDSVIQFKFNRDSSTLTATGRLTSSKDRIVGYLAADREVDLTAVLEPADKKLNIRFSQIILPDGKTDGPFGQKLQYKLKQVGTYQIVIAPNNMADGATSGDFTIRLGVSPNPHE